MTKLPFRTQQAVERNSVQQEVNEKFRPHVALQHTIVYSHFSDLYSLVYSRLFAQGMPGLDGFRTIVSRQIMDIWDFHLDLTGPAGAQMSERQER